MLNIMRMITLQHPEPAASGTKEEFTAEAAGRCITLQRLLSVWRMVGGWEGWLEGVGDTCVICAGSLF